MFLSILIPNYGYCESLTKCLDSVANQTILSNFDFEIILCDQSHGQERKSVEKACSSINKLELIRLDKPDVLEARKFLLQHAKGEYVFFVDSDDYIDQGLINNIHNSIINNQYPDLLVTSYFMDTNGSSIQNKDLSYININNFHKYFLCSNLMNTLWRKIFKRTIYNRNDIIDLHSINGDDWIISFSVVKNAKRICFDPAICGYHYCDNNSSLTHTLTFERFKNSLCLKDKFVKESPLFDGALIFRSKMVGLLAYCTLLNKANKNKSEMKNAFEFIRHNILVELKIKYKIVTGAKNKILFLILKFNRFRCFKFLIKRLIKQ